MPLPIATRRLVLQLDYQQIARNDISFLGLQFFVVGLHSDIRLEVIKSGTTDMYEAFLIKHAYETAVKDKKKRGNELGSLKINKMDAEFEDSEEAQIEAIRQKFQQRKMFRSNNGSAYQQHSIGGNGSNNGNSNGNCNGNGNGNGNGNNRNGGGQQSGSVNQHKPNPAFGKTCHYCKKKNHFQSDCYRRKRDEAPMVKVTEVEDQEGGKVETIFKSKN
jgi:hypothetical protein